MDLVFYRTLSGAYGALVQSENFHLLSSETRNKIFKEIRDFAFSMEKCKRFWVVSNNEILRPSSEYDCGVIAARNADTQIAIGVANDINGFHLHLYKVD